MRLTLMTALAVLAGPAAPLQAQTVTADPTAAVDYSGTLKVLTKFGTQRLQPYFVEIARAYEAARPGVTIELIQEDDDSVKTKTKTLVASNAMPDVFFSWTGTWGGNFVRGQRAVELTLVVASDWGKSLAPAVLDAFVYGGKNYGIPLYLDAKFMGYFKPAFAAAGVEVPKTLEDLLAACDKLKASGLTPIAIGNKEPWGAVHYLGQMLAYDEPRAVLEADFDTATATYTDPGYVTALNHLGELAARCTVGPEMNRISCQTALQSFSDGKAAMSYQEIIEFDNAASATTKLKPEEFGFFRLPAPADAKGDAKALEGAPEGYMVSSTSANVPLALDFLKFVTTPENGMVLSAPPYGQPSAVVGGAGPATMNPAVVAGLQDLAQASYLIQWLDTVNHRKVAAAWLSNLQAFLGGSMTADEVMTEVRAAGKAVK